eukprot:TRINITY_DN6618_c0_g3_i1.p1 TRINITY_DN6618_c0_g3~~TRINITY_DN6618_c0_g3_i1.p1  ORF type:complete len:567 (+),score=56.09 TRINITY_DN6618_c0_g3_i1:60-1703(+)
MSQACNQHAVMCELIPGRLIWSPETSCAPADFKGNFNLIRDLVGEYRIPHYSRQACGRAFGPLGLDETLKFCMKIDATLSKLAEDVQSGSISKEEGILCIGTSPMSMTERANAAVLVGAYLILFCKWKVDDVAAAMCQDSSRLFMCSWSRMELEESNRTLSVRNCWEGLQLAVQHGWLQCVKENEYAIEAFLQEYTSISLACDASWIIPSQLLVCADPMTTIYDPNPETITELFPADSQHETSASGLKGSISCADCSSVSPQASCTSSTASQPSSALTAPLPRTAWSIQSAEGTVALGVPARSFDLYEGMQQKLQRVQTFGRPVLCPQGDMDAPPTWSAFCQETTDDMTDDDEEPCSPKSVNSVDTVNKEYTIRESMLGKVGFFYMDFATFLRSNEVRLMVRANYVNESGMPPSENCRMYDREKFKSNGICQVDVQFLDLHGAVPPRHQVRRMLRCCRHHMSGDGDAVVVHCKGGFGRSVVLAACLAIERLDISGSALMGWIRMVRPGSVNTIRQERFLASLRGRADVLSYAGGTGIFPRPACCSFW